MSASLRVALQQQSLFKNGINPAEGDVSFPRTGDIRHNPHAGGTHAIA
jgi:hypothetical protein